MGYFNSFTDENMKEQFEADMDRKYPLYYKTLKLTYPQIWRLPENEIDKIRSIAHNEGHELEDGLAKVDEYARSKASEWGFDLLADRRDCLTTPSVPVQPPKPQVPENRVGKYAGLTNYYLNFSDDDDVEGYYNYPYCDTAGKTTVGGGMLVPNRTALDTYSMTSQNAPVSTNNPLFTPQQKDDFWNKHRTFCDTYKTVNEKGKTVWNPPLPEAQRDKYKTLYNEDLPYFDDEELRDKKYSYIEGEIPPLARDLAKLGVDFDSLNQDCQTGFLDWRFNLGQGNSRFGYGDIDDGYWPKFTDAIKTGDFTTAAKESHRKGISERRNQTVHDLIKRCGYK